MPTDARVEQKGLIENNERDNKKFPGGGYSDFIEIFKLKCIID